MICFEVAFSFSGLGLRSLLASSFGILLEESVGASTRKEELDDLDEEVEDFSMFLFLLSAGSSSRRLRVRVWMVLITSVDAT